MVSEGYVRVRGRSGDSQVRVKSQKYSELDIGGRENCLEYFLENCEAQVQGMSDQ